MSNSSMLGCDNPFSQLPIVVFLLWNYEIMVKKVANKKRRRQKFDPVVKILAAKHSLSTRQIRNIRDGKRRNDVVLSDYTTLKEWFSMAETNIDKRTIEKVKELVSHKKK